MKLNDKIKKFNALCNVRNLNCKIVLKQGKYIYVSDEITEELTAEELLLFLDNDTMDTVAGYCNA